MELLIVITAPKVLLFPLLTYLFLCSHAQFIFRGNFSHHEKSRLCFCFTGTQENYLLAPKPNAICSNHRQSSAYSRIVSSSLGSPWRSIQPSPKSQTWITKRDRHKTIIIRVLAIREVQNVFKVVSPYICVKRRFVNMKNWQQFLGWRECVCRKHSQELLTCLTPSTARHWI